MMPKVTFKTEPVIYITVRGEGEPGEILRDNGIVAKLRKFLYENNIDPAASGGYSGAGAFCGFYNQADAMLITEWLYEQGVQRL